MNRRIYIIILSTVIYAGTLRAVGDQTNVLIALKESCDFDDPGLWTSLKINKEDFLIFKEIKVICGPILSQNYSKTISNRWVKFLELDISSQLNPPQSTSAPRLSSRQQTVTGRSELEREWAFERIKHHRSLKEYLSNSLNNSTDSTDLSTSDLSRKSIQDVDVFVLDTGILSSHVSFKDNFKNSCIKSIWSAYDDEGEDHQGHGTHIASTVKKVAQNHVNIHAYKVLDDEGNALITKILAGINRVLEHEKTLPSVVNMSLAGPASDILDHAVKMMTNKGFIVVNAAGNNRRDASSTSPARIDETITVAASNQTDYRAPFSNFGNTVDLFAPGCFIVAGSSRTDTHFKGLNGTSMAAAMVTGVVAKILQRFPEAKAFQIKEFLCLNATENILQGIHPGTPNRLLFAEIDRYKLRSLPIVPSKQFQASSQEAPDYGFISGTNEEIFTPRSVAEFKRLRRDSRLNVSLNKISLKNTPLHESSSSIYSSGEYGSLSNLRTPQVCTSAGTMPTGETTIHNFNLNTESFIQVTFLSAGNTLYQGYIEHQNESGKWEKIHGSELTNATDIMQIELKEPGNYRFSTQNPIRSSGYSFELQILEGFTESP